MCAVVLLPTAQRDVESLDSTTLRHLDNLFDLLSEFPLAGQAAELPNAPHVRRLVCGDRLIFYSHNEPASAILIYTVRHGARRPPESLSDLEK
jgi:plasmid stabilization system protein ParE